MSDKSVRDEQYDRALKAAFAAYESTWGTALTLSGRLLLGAVTDAVLESLEEPCGICSGHGCPTCKSLPMQGWREPTADEITEALSMGRKGIAEALLSCSSHDSRVRVEVAIAAALEEGLAVLSARPAGVSSGAWGHALYEATRRLR